MSAATIIALWKDARGGLIEEVEKIPEDQFSFKATPDTRSVAELLQHIISTQQIIVGEACRPDTDLRRQSFAAHAAEYSPGVSDVSDKNGLIELLRSSMDDSAARITSYGEKLEDSMLGLTGQPLTKSAFLTFGLSHEMYHRGQLTVYERLLSIEPALTEKFRRLTASAG
jgi:uncharacterized damage-inducible protein DinB